MARIRSIHPGLWTDERFVSVSRDARLLFIGILNECDDQGLFAWKPLQIKMRLAAGDDVSSAVVSGWMEELAGAGIVKAYEVDGPKLGAVRNFRRWQRPEKPKHVYPLPDDLRSFVGMSATDGATKPDQSPTVPTPDGKASTTSRQPIDDLSPTGSRIAPQRKEEGGKRERKKTDSDLRFVVANGDRIDVDDADSHPAATRADTTRTVEAAIAAWNAICGAKLTAVVKITPARRQAFLRRFEDDFGQDPAEWERYCRRVVASPFLTNAGGNNRGGWKANFDFVLEPRNVVRIVEGEWDPPRERGPAVDIEQSRVSPSNPTGRVVLPVSGGF